jgi:hypothetical protein
LDLLFERLDSVVGGVLDDVLQLFFGLGLALTLDDERVGRELRGFGAELLGVTLHVLNDGREVVEATAVHEQHVGVLGGHLPGRL